MALTLGALLFLETKNCKACGREKSLLVAKERQQMKVISEKVSVVIEYVKKGEFKVRFDGIPEGTRFDLQSHERGFNETTFVEKGDVIKVQLPPVVLEAKYGAIYMQPMPMGGLN